MNSNRCFTWMAQIIVNTVSEPKKPISFPLRWPEKLDQVHRVRLKGPMPFEGLNVFNGQRMYYVSVHSTQKQTFNYGKARLARQVTDDWLEGTLVYAGCRFEPAPSALTDDDARPQQCGIS